MFERLDLILPERAFQGAMQMALDEALMRSVRRPTLRCYLWEGPCVTYGYFQRYAEVRKVRPGVPAVRRWTGGGMVDHGSDFTFSLMIPAGNPPGELPPNIFYRELHGILARWLSKRIFQPIRLAGEGDLRGGAVCFSAPAGDDLLLGGRKILGGAQRRSHGALLYQGSIQFPGAETLDPVALGAALHNAPGITSLGGDVVEKAIGIARERYSARDWEERW